MTRFQRFVLGGAAILLALRAFFPVHQEDTSRIDIFSTGLHLFGILVVAAAAYILLPELNVLILWSNLRKRLLGVALLAAWFGYILLGVLGIREYGLAANIQDVNWLLSGLAFAGFVFMLGVSWRWIRVPKVAKRVFWTILGLTVVAITVEEAQQYDGTLGWFLAYALTLATAVGANALLMYLIWLAMRGVARLMKRET